MPNSTNYITNSQVQTDPKLRKLTDKLNSLEEQKKLIESYVTAYNVDGMFNMSYTIDVVKSGSSKLFDEAKKIRKKEEGGDGKTCTYVRAVRDPEIVLLAASPLEFTISDVVYYQYTEEYNTEDKQKEKNNEGKTPSKIYNTVTRNLEHCAEYKTLQKNWKACCKTYKKWLDNIDKYEDIQKSINSVKEDIQKYNEAQAEKERIAEINATNREIRIKSEFEENLRKYTADPLYIKSYSSAELFFIKFYSGPEKLQEIYENMGVGLSGAKRESEINTFNRLQQLADEVIKTAKETRNTFVDEYENNKNAKPDYKDIKKAYAAWDKLYDSFNKEINKNKVDAQNQYNKSVKEKRKSSKNASSKAKREAEKKELIDNVDSKTIDKMSDNRGKGTNDGGSGSPDAPAQQGSISEGQVNSALATAVGNTEETTTQNQDTRIDEDKWTDLNEIKIKSKKSGLSEEQQANATTDMSSVLANVASNIVGAVLTDPSLAQTVNGLASTGAFDIQSIRGAGNNLLASSVNTLSNAMMNTLGVGTAEEVIDNALKATNTIITNATNIVPTMKELTVAAITTVKDELTSHIAEKVESILDPTAITSQIQNYTSYYVQLYTKSADDLKKKLLSPGDEAVNDLISKIDENSKNARMQTMTSKVTDLKNKLESAVEVTKGGVKMVATYINNGPDWVVKQLSTYTNFAISQAEKYIDYGADYIVEQRDMWIASASETIGKRFAENVNSKLEQATKKALDYIEVKKKYVTQVAVSAIMTAVQIVVSKLGPLVGTALKAGAKLGMKQLLKTIGG